MKKIVLFLMLLSIEAHAQNDKLSFFINDFFNKNWKIKDSISLDLNNDGFSDYVIVFESKTLHVRENSNYISDSFYYPKSLVILFGQAKDRYKKILEISTVFDGDKCCGIQGQDPYTGLFKRKNTFTIQFTTGGSSGREDVSYILRYQNNNFYCIGFDDWRYELPLSENGGHSSSANYITGEVEEYDITVNGKKINYLKKITKKKPLLKLIELTCPFKCD